jgi:hypothetical protein
MRGLPISQQDEEESIPLSRSNPDDHPHPSDYELGDSPKENGDGMMAKRRDNRVNVDGVARRDEGEPIFDVGDSDGEDDYRSK